MFFHAAAKSMLFVNPSAPPPSEGWVTILDFNLSTQSNQTLGSDIAYTIGGLTFNKINSANDQVPAAIVNGSGLVIQPNAGDFVGATRTLPALTLDFAQIITGYGLDTPIRIWLYNSTFTSIGYSYAYAAIENWTVGDAFINNRRFYLVPPGDINYYFRSLYNFTTLSYDSGPASGYGANNVLMIECSLGVAQGWACSFIGTWSAGWPALNTLQPIGTHQMFDGSIGDSSNIGLASGWNILIGACGGVGFSCTFVNMRIDYRI